MNVEKFLGHHGITENPFGAEEARHDPVFERLIEQFNQAHPDFAKILGRIDRPNTSVVFGEKGSGKTAIRLMIGRKVAEHNQTHPDNRTLLVAYDDWNPVLDAIMNKTGKNRDRVGTRGRGRGRAKKRDGNELDRVRLEDHQDAILSRAVTKLVNALVGRDADNNDSMPLPDELGKRIKQMPRRQRVDLALLAALYDQPFSGDVVERSRKLRTKLKLGWHPNISWLRLIAIMLSLVAVGMIATPLLAALLPNIATVPGWLMPTAGMVGGAALIAWGVWLVQHMRLWRLCRAIRRETPAINRAPGQLRELLRGLKAVDMVDQPFPVPSDVDSNNRYHLTGKLLDALESFGYRGVMVLIDRVDEPTLISGQPDRMRAVIWPMLDNKFLQQEGIGLKLLLPVELSHILKRQSSEFFQEARLDKQHLVDPLTWSGATLYDLCSARLSACRPTEADPVYLTDMFEPDVSREMLVDALDQMHQPRDAFKFLYSVIQEHCRVVPEDQAQYAIPRLTLENVRRTHSQRVQDFYRGLSPA
jgi:hypothetical protein